jgi:predicted nucleotidyltransferase
MTGDPVLARVRDALRDMYGDNIDRIVLFGSRARGDARDDSDYDVAVFLKTMPDRWEEMDRLADLRVELIDETGFFFDLLPFAAERYDARTPLMWDIRGQGQAL